MSLITAALSTKVLVSLVATGVIAFGGTGLAAYAGVLPDGLQQTASEIIGAPTPEDVVAPDAGVVADEESTIDTDTDTDTDTGTGTDTEVPDSGSDTEDSEPDPILDSKGPDATGSAAYGLCNAYSRGGLPEHSTAYQSLFRAADADTDAYGATVTKPGSKDDADAETVESEDPAAEADESESESTQQPAKVEKAEKAEKVGKPAKAEKPGK